MQTETILFIKSELEPQSAGDACSACLVQIAEAASLIIEFDKPNANIFALQLAISCKKSLEAQNGFLGFGPIAQRELGQLMTDTPPHPNATTPMKEPA